MTFARQMILSVLVLGLAAAGWYAYAHRASLFGGEATATAATSGGPRQGAGGQGGGPGGRQAPRVVTAEVTTDTTGIEVRAIGTLLAAKEVVLVSQVSGIVKDIDFTPGSHVDAGAVLIRLDDDDQQVAVDKAQIAVDNANAALDRAERLAKSSNITAVALSDAQSAARGAAIDLRSAQLELQKRTVTAPFAGTIGLTDLSVGDLMTSSKVIATLDDVSTLTVSFDVPQSAVGALKIGQDVQAISEAAPDKTFTGKVSAIDNRLDVTTRTLKIEATLPNDSDVLKPGMAVTVSMSFPATPRPSVPSLAIQWDREGSYVWKLDGDVVHRTAVQIVTRRSGEVTVTGDLAPPDAVVVEGIQRLRDGIKVAVPGAGGGAPGGATAPSAAAEGAPGNG